MNAVITAGGRIGGEYAREAGTTVKALAPIRGSTMLERVIPESVGGAENVMKALRAWADSDDALIYATSDMPYVDALGVRGFVERARPGCIAVALCEFDAFSRRFAGAPPGFGITLAGERVVNGGLFVIPPGTAARVEGVARRLFDARKQPWRMASLVDFVSLLRWAAGRLAIADLEAQAQRVAGVPAHGVRACAPELGFDADTVEAYRYARSHA